MERKVRPGRLGTGILLMVLMVASAQAELADTIEKIKPGIVGVGLVRPTKGIHVDQSNTQFVGTGFVVGNGKQVITNHHVVLAKAEDKPGETLVVFIGHGARAIGKPLRIVRTDPAHDLALLEFSGDPLPALVLSDQTTVREGDEIAFTGFPIGVVLGLYPVTHKGIVSAITPIVTPAASARTLTAAQIKQMRTPFNIYQLDATAYPGSSGSPVFDIRTGKVIAVVNSVFVKETKENILSEPSNISYAIPIEYVRQLLEER